MYGGVKKQLCGKCYKEISVNNFNRHYISCLASVPKKIRGIDFDPNIGFKNGTRHAWNKGLSKNTDNRVLKNGLALKGHPNIGKCADPEKEKQRICKLSVNAKKQGFGGYNKNAGHSKKFKYQDSFGNIVTLQSTYELDTAKLLDSLNIKWIRPSYLTYYNKKYYPDFLLVDYNIYLDPKNSYLAIKDKDKIRLASEQNNVKIFILEQTQINKEYINTILARNSAVECNPDKIEVGGSTPSAPTNYM